mgnify:CR=1 FL=1
MDTAEGWLYVALVMDLFGGRLVGWAMGDRIDTRLTTEALGLALGLRDPPPGLLRHSDRGSQYCAHDYRDALEDRGVTVSMSRRANCYDNPPMESHSPVQFERRVDNAPTANTTGRHRKLSTAARLACERGAARARPPVDNLLPGALLDVQQTGTNPRNDRQQNRVGEEAARHGRTAPRCRQKPWRLRPNSIPMDSSLGAGLGG